MAGLQALALSALNWGSEAAANAMLLRVPAHVHQAAAAAAAPGHSSSSSKGGSCSGSGSSNGGGTMLAVSAVARKHDLAVMVVGPAIMLAASLAMAAGALPYYPLYVGTAPALIMCCVYRMLVLPSVQQLGVRQAWRCAPLLALAEALQVHAMQPAWGWRAVVGTVVVWRVAAAAVAGLWERRARGRFAAGVALRAAEAAAQELERQRCIE